MSFTIPPFTEAMMKVIQYIVLSKRFVGLKCMMFDVALQRVQMSQTNYMEYLCRLSYTAYKPVLSSSPFEELPDPNNFEYSCYGRWHVCSSWIKYIYLKNSEIPSFNVFLNSCCITSKLEVIVVQNDFIHSLKNKTNSSSVKRVFPVCLLLAVAWY